MKYEKNKNRLKTIHMEFPRIKYLSQTKTDSMLPLLKYITLLELSQAAKYSNRTLNMNVPESQERESVW